MLVQLFALPIFAQDTRVDAITQNSLYTSGGYLLEDEYLIQYYPSSVFRYGTHATLQQPNVGNVVFGNFGYASAMYVHGDFAIGTYVNRTGVNIPALDILRPVEVLGAYNFGSFQAGVLFSVENVSTKDTVTVDPNSFEMFVFGMQPSISYEFSDSSGIDVAVPIILGNAGNRTGATTNSESSASGIGISGRFYSPKFVVPFNIGSASLTTNIPTITTTNKLTEGYFFLGAGRMHQLNQHNLLIYGVNINSRSSEDEETVVNTTNTDIISNMNVSILMGGEFSFWKNRLKARGSFSYNLFTQIKDEQIITDLGAPGAFSLGLGYDSKHFRVDAALSTQLMTNGFFFLTGNNSFLFPRITLIGRL